LNWTLFKTPDNGLGSRGWGGEARSTGGAEEEGSDADTPLRQRRVHELARVRPVQMTACAAKKNSEGKQGYGVVH